MAIRHVSAAVVMLALAVIGTGDRAKGQAAPSPDAIQAARELTALVNASTSAALISNLNNQMWPGLEAALRRQHPSMDAATLSELRAEFERLQLAAVRDVLDGASILYARQFAIHEMREMIAFYRTPAGAKALSLMPQISAEMISAMGPRMQTLQQSLAHSFIAVLERKGYRTR